MVYLDYLKWIILNVQFANVFDFFSKYFKMSFELNKLSPTTLFTSVWCYTTERIKCFLTRLLLLNILVVWKIILLWSSRHGAVETNPTRNHEVVGLIPGLAQGVKDLALSRAVV